MGREANIKADMEAAGVYSPIYDKAIHELAKAERALSRAEKDWKAHGGQTVATMTNKTGAEYTAKDPYWTVVEDMRKTVTSMRNQLGLTPAGRARSKSKKAEAADKSKGGKLGELLTAAKTYAQLNADGIKAEVDGYISGVLSGEIEATVEIRQSCQRYLTDLDNPKWDFRAEPANEVVGIIETMITHQKGEFMDGTPLRGTPFILLPYHKFIVYNIMGFYRAGTIERRFKEAFDFVPRKNIKTTFAAALAWAIGLYYSASGSEIYVVGGALKQAMQSFDFLRYNLKRLALTTEDDPDNGIRIINNNMEHSMTGDFGDEGYFSLNALAASSDKQDSFNANIVLADEMHSYKSPTQYQVLKDACKAYTNRLVIGISSGGHLAQGFCARRVAYCKKILDGTIKGDEADSIFIFLAQAPQDDSGEVDYTNPKIMAACNPGWGHSIRPQDMINDAAQARDDPQLRPEFLTKSLNVFIASMRAWFDVEEWRRSDRKYSWTMDELAKLPIKWYGGTDLSKLYDLTAGCLFGHYQGVDIIVPHCWFPQTAAAVKAREDEIPLFGWQDDGWLDMCNDAVLNHSDVVKWYMARRTQGFNIRLIGHDRKFCRDYFIEMKKQGFNIKDQPQLFTRKSEGFRYLEASAKRGTLYYLHAEPMEYCVTNVKAGEKADDMVQYEKIAPHLRIDVFDAAVFAACTYLEDKEKAEKSNGWFSG